MSIHSLNYHHLRYFWLAVREGSVTRAAQKLRVAQPTVSEQLKELELSVGGRLFGRSGRKLELTELGVTVYRYADEIFSLGQELLETLHGQSRSRATRLVVGIADAVPKRVASMLLEPLCRAEPPVRVVCVEGKPERLMNELSAHLVDVVLDDAPVRASEHEKIRSELLLEATVGIFGLPSLANNVLADFPRALDNAPFLLPMPGSALRRALEQWFDSCGIHPRIVGEFQDTALLTAFGDRGVGLFAAPDLPEHQQGAAIRAGRVETLHERCYAITVERRLPHPAVRALVQTWQTV